jgi:hypothetical protein
LVLHSTPWFSLRNYGTAFKVTSPPIDPHATVYTFNGTGFDLNGIAAWLLMLVI